MTMQRALAWLVVGLLSAFMACADEPSDIVQPEIVLPGEWLTDTAEHFLFLPLTVPADIKLDHCKVMSNGEQILVVVTETPDEEPDTKALSRYKLLVEAIKAEVKGDESQLQLKLQSWYDTESDEEVRVHIKAAIDSLTTVKSAKLNKSPRIVSVPLGLLAKQAAQALQTSQAASFLARVDAHNASSPVKETKEELEAEHVLAHLHHATNKATKVGIIKESFAIEIPYPVPIDRVFMLKTTPGTLIVSMPLLRKSLEASGISTGGKPFNRVPVFAVDGQLLAGPAGRGLNEMASGLHVPSVSKQTSLKPLT